MLSHPSTEKRRRIGNAQGLSPGVNRDNRWRACFRVDHADLEHNLDVAISKFASELLLEHLEVMRAGGKLCGGFGAVAAEPGKRHHPSVDIGVAKPRNDGVVVGA